MEAQGAMALFSDQSGLIFLRPLDFNYFDGDSHTCFTLLAQPTATTFPVHSNEQSPRSTPLAYFLRPEK
jgi:hypothetical protein